MIRISAIKLIATLSCFFIQIQASNLIDSFNKTEQVRYETSNLHYWRKIALEDQANLIADDWVKPIGWSVDNYANERILKEKFPNVSGELLGSRVYANLFEKAQLLRKLETKLSELGVKNPQDHVLIQASSLPLTSRQMKALKKYTKELDEKHQEDIKITRQNKENDTNLQQPGEKAVLELFEPFWNWNGQDAAEILSLYEEYKKADSSVPFISWVTELYDIRMANLREINRDDIAFHLTKEFLAPWLKNRFKTAVKKYTQEQYDAACKALADVCLYGVINKTEHELKDRFVESLKPILNSQDFPFIVFKYLIASDDPYESIRWQNDAKIGEIVDFRHKLNQQIRMFSQLSRAKVILDEWNCRNFKLIGSGDSVNFFNPIIGKGYGIEDSFKHQFIFNKDGMIHEDILSWLQNPLEAHFPFNMVMNDAAKQRSHEDSVDDITDLVSELFNFADKLNSHPDQKGKFDEMNLEVLVKYSEDNVQQTKYLTGSASDIVSQLLIDINNNYSGNHLAKLYQSIYQIMFLTALTDNHFAYKLLWNSKLLYSHTHLLSHNDSKYNIVAFLMSLVRMNLLKLMEHNDQFQDFVTSAVRYKVRGKGKIYPTFRDAAGNVRVSQNRAEIPAFHIDGISDEALQNLFVVDLNRNDKEDFWGNVKEVFLGRGADIECLDLIPSAGKFFTPTYNKELVEGVTKQLFKGEAEMEHIRQACLTPELIKKIIRNILN